MNNAAKTNALKILAEVTSLMVFQDRDGLELYLLDLTAQRSDTNLGRKSIDAIVTVAQDFIGGYGWSEADVEAAEDYLEALAA